MPLPKPQKNETREDFLDRCMDNGEMVNEFPDAKQRYAVCVLQWDYKKACDILNSIKKKISEK